MSRNKVFTGPLAEHLRGLLEEKRSLGYKYEEQARLISVLDEMSKQYNCSEGLSRELCLAFVERKPNWRQAMQEGRVALIRILAEYMIRHDALAYLIDSNIVTNQHEDFKPYIYSQTDIRHLCRGR